MTELATEMPRCFSISIQSLVACREALRAFTLPAIWIAPENSSSFSVSVVLPASGWEMMANVRRRRVSLAWDKRELRGRVRGVRARWNAAWRVAGKYNLGTVFRGALQRPCCRQADRRA